MSAGTSEFFCLICFLVCSCSAQINIRAEVGKDVILPCKAPNNININNALVEWSRPELEPHFVLRYRQRTEDPDNQLPSYKNRVDLQDKEMKNGNVSLILKNVRLFDIGKYKCRVFENGKKDSINIIDLEVLPSVSVKDHQDQIRKTERKVGLAVGLPLSILLIPAVALYVYTRRQKGNVKTSVKEMQQQLQQLEEMKLNTNSDPTGSDEKNQQEELKKLQDEKQKWMKTVVKLKTELQNMNQELKPIETVMKEKVCGCCPSKNNSTGFSECSTSPP